MRIKFGTYGQYSGNNGCHCMYLVIGTVALYFSYQTIVAFKEADDKLFISENRWGPTTGKHLNLIDSDPKNRIPRKEFEAELQAMLKRHNMEV